MRRIALLTVFMAAFALIATGCDLSLNLFSGLGTPDYNADKILDKASSNPAGAVEDVEDMLETEQIDDSNKDTIISALDDVIASSSADPQTKQKASLLSAQIEINTDDGAKTLVTNTASVINDVISSDTTPDESSLISALTAGVANKSNDQLTSMFESLGDAATDYENFASLLGTTPDLSDGEQGDLLIMATMTIALRDVYQAAVANGEETQLFDVIRGDADYSTLTGTSSTYDPATTFDSAGPLMSIVEYIDGTDGEIYQALSDISGA